jgi:hypothetical protein
MTRQSRLWLLAAGTVSVAVVVVVLVFGTSMPPSFPSLSDSDVAVVMGTVAYTDGDDPDIIHVLDLAAGSSVEYRCSHRYCLHHWDASGLLAVHSEPFGDLALVDPVSGSVVPGDPSPRADLELLTTDQADGRLVLRYDDGLTRRVLLDLEVPRDYRLRNAGLSGDESWAWFVDSEGRLIGLAVDGSSGPWLLADHAHDAAWK